MPVDKRAWWAVLTLCGPRRGYHILRTVNTFLLATEGAKCPSKTRPAHDIILPREPSRHTGLTNRIHELHVDGTGPDTRASIPIVHIAYKVVLTFCACRRSPAGTDLPILARSTEWCTTADESLPLLTRFAGHANIFRPGIPAADGSMAFPVHGSRKRAPPVEIRRASGIRKNAIAMPGRLV